MVYRKPQYFEGQVDAPIPARRILHARRESLPNIFNQRNTYCFPCIQSHEIQYTSAVEDNLEALRIGSRATEGKRRSQWTIEVPDHSDVDLIIQDRRGRVKELRVSPDRSRANRQTLPLHSTSSDDYTAVSENLKETEISDFSTSSGYSSVSFESRDECSSVTPTSNYRICSNLVPICLRNSSRRSFPYPTFVPMTFRRPEVMQIQHVKAGYRPCSRSPCRTKIYFKQDMLPSCNGSRSRTKICTKTSSTTRRAYGCSACGGRPCPCSGGCRQYAQDCSWCENANETSECEESNCTEEVVWSRKVCAKPDSEDGYSNLSEPTFELPAKGVPLVRSRIVTTGDCSESSDMYSSTVETFDYSCGSVGCGPKCVSSGRGVSRFSKCIEPPTTKMKHSLEKWLSDD